MKIVPFSLIVVALMLSCIPDNVKEKMNKQLEFAGQMMADMEFKKAIANIELYKLRNGNYPNSLSELQFLSAMDSSIFQNVEYTRLDTVYELNLNFKLPSFTDKTTEGVQLHYPPEFWKGLGCVKSNLKEDYSGEE